MKNIGKILKHKALIYLELPSVRKIKPPEEKQIGLQSLIYPNATSL